MLVALAFISACIIQLSVILRQGTSARFNEFNFALWTLLFLRCVRAWAKYSRAIQLVVVVVGGLALLWRRYELKSISKYLNTRRYSACCCGFDACNNSFSLYIIYTDYKAILVCIYVCWCARLIFGNYFVIVAQCAYIRAMKRWGIMFSRVSLFQKREYWRPKNINLYALYKCARAAQIWPSLELIGNCVLCRPPLHAYTQHSFFLIIIIENDERATSSVS